MTDPKDAKKKTDPKDIKKQTQVDSKDLDPEATGKELDEVEDEALEDLSGGVKVRYPDRWTPGLKR